jgi:polyhydroxyalkanoate synthesis regulator phasin
MPWIEGGIMARDSPPRRRYEKCNDPSSKGGLHMPRPKKAMKVPHNGRPGLVGRARAEAEGLVKDVRRVGASVQKQAERAMRDVERRAQRILGGLENRAIKALEPVLRRTFATQREVRAVQATVAELTRKVDAMGGRPAA